MLPLTAIPRPRIPRRSDRAGYPHREVFFTKARDHFDLAEPVDELWSRYRRRMPHLVHCRPEVMNGLSRLRASGWKVGIITNGTADNQLGKIQRTGLAEAVDAYALSGLEGIRKPDTGLFEIAAQRCGMALADGGRAAGLRTVWVGRGTWPGQEHEADHVVTDVLQAMKILHDKR
ncbi:HAD family hydrolase [Streptosporangium sp. NPDC006013]|uniref:HAD family hydrolase n=1 Tax=Streptosporangium sp. NPDC006013 TaxID=3155596 RepID=UPI0033AA846A